MIGIYKITSPSNRIYIGQSKNIERRLQEYIKIKCEAQPRLYYSIIKHGWDTHIFEIIEECEFNSLNKRERYWQDFYNATGETGLNCQLTNDLINTQKQSKETIDKIILGLTGRPCSPETRLKISKAHKGRIFSDERKQNISASLKGRKIPKETLEKRSKSISGEKNYKAKLILNTSTGIYYGCIADAAFSISIPKSTLNGYLIGIRPNKTYMKYA